MSVPDNTRHMTLFNPLHYRACLSPIEPPPEESAWQEHIPFAGVLIEMLRPRVLVELGVHTGASYLAFCHAIAAQGLSCTCYGVDSFVGDQHAGKYGSEVEMRLRTRHDPLFGGFSQIITSTFDEAAQHLEDGSIDLLHIDGLHTYEAVRHDFETWARTLSTRAVVLFHDINVREHGFGVWRLWNELCARYPYFSFKHGHGLGMLAVGTDVPPGLGTLLELDDNDAGRLGDLFFLLGNRISLQVQIATLKSQLMAQTSRLSAVEASLRKREDEVTMLRQHVASLQEDHLQHETVIAGLRRQIGGLNEILGRIHRSVSFRIGMGATAPIRWITERMAKGH